LVDVNGDTLNHFSHGNTPQQIGTNANWQALSASPHAVALRTDGTLWTWGQNVAGQLGNGINTGTNAPQQVGTNTNWGPPP
jgi:alpha-tubulin suppressor-like RCC1 family protein